MELGRQSGERGIALIIVMAVVFVLSVLAGGFAYSMRVEMRLAQNHNHEAELEWLGRSGVELARYVLGQQLAIGNEPYDALNQKWAGGIGVTNENLMDISMDNNTLGSGSFSIKIIDQERRFNINAADEVILQQAINLVGVDASDSSTIVDSILDWRDPDDDPHLSGTESDYYLGLDPPYYAKNGPIDDLSELLMIRGITPEIYYGQGDQAIASSRQTVTAANRIFGQNAQPVCSGGLADLFTPISTGLVNINTASSAVLQLIPGIDANTAAGIIQARAGPDGVEGNDDDTPFRNVGELINVPGINPQLVGQIGRFFTVRSATFEVQVDAQIDHYKHRFVAMLRRNSPRDIRLLYFNWK
ncbi:MAG: type II secretion system protein GspK [Candidatus Omnitrophica bacterium]|nr:type II secretion system protein GspK [Candidatus Omnitrophota bacterium]